MKSISAHKLTAAVIIAAFVFAWVPGLEGGSVSAQSAPNAMVASQHELASRIGVDVLRKGGNAIDAAIAVGIALAVVYPEAGNIGGGGFMLIRFKDGRTTAIDYREMAPKAAHKDLYLDKNGELIRGEGGSALGYRASGVPGTLAGFEMAFKKYGSGKVKWSELVTPSVRLARDGYVLSKRLADLFVEYRETLAKYPDSNRIFLRNGSYFKEGDVLKQPELGDTLARVSRNGAKEFYTGRTARLIAADMKANNGLITLEDLKNYKAKERMPLRGTYRGHEIITMPPPSSGGIVMLQVLNMLEGYDLAGMPHDSAKKYHLLAESSRRAFADRAEYMADPDFADVPVAKLVDKQYAAARRATIDLERASASREIRFGQFVGVYQDADKNVRVPRKEGTETTHYTIVDAEGNVVSNTYTINDLYGSRVTIKGTGILMNDEMDDFSSRPDRPNIYGLIQGQRNKIEGGKRPLSSMTPTIVMRKDGTPWFALGARGGPRIISSVIQSVINVIDHDMDLQRAIDAPRIHHQWLPDELVHEPDKLKPEQATLDRLSSLGHKFAQKPIKIAQATGVLIDERGVKRGAIDQRGDGAAIGY